ncbi:MAG: hypothetical protein N2422_01495 [Rhodobacteraceae bacterium]|nr:hypothetical protein [Paracoccaceae bacterium]
MRAALATLVLAAGPALAGDGDGDALPEGATYIIQLTSSQYASGLGEFLVPPLTRAFGRTSLTYRGGPGADLVATVEHSYDSGSWHGTGAGRIWLHDTAVTVGLSPADMDVEPEGRLSPAFSVSARLLTPDADREDEIVCLIGLAVRELARRYRPEGHVTVDGSGCARPG